MCAAVGAEVYPDLVKAGDDMGPKARVVSPDTRAVQEYARYYERWLKVAKWLDSLGEEMM
jgi:ribulose kinase